MRFQVPQFIDVEDKVFGPFSFKQFIYLAGGAGLSFILLKTLPRFIAIIAIVPVATFSLALAFYRMNNRPFINTVEAFFNYAIRSRLYIWKKSEKKEGQSTKVNPYAKMEIPTLSEGKLKEINQALDMKPPEENQES